MTGATSQLGFPSSGRPVLVAITTCALIDSTNLRMQASYAGHRGLRGDFLLPNGHVLCFFGMGDGAYIRTSEGVLVQEETDAEDTGCASMGSPRQSPPGEGGWQSLRVAGHAPAASLVTDHSMYRWTDGDALEMNDDVTQWFVTLATKESMTLLRLLGSPQAR